MSSARSSKLYAGQFPTASGVSAIYTSAAGRVTLLKFLTTANFGVSSAIHYLEHRDTTGTVQLALFTFDTVPTNAVSTHFLGGVLEPGEQLWLGTTGPLANTQFAGVYGSVLTA